MEMNTADVEPVTISDILNIATWNRPRTDIELRNFISRRESVVTGYLDES